MSSRSASRRDLYDDDDTTSEYEQEERAEDELQPRLLSSSSPSSSASPSVRARQTSRVSETSRPIMRSGDVSSQKSSENRRPVARDREPSFSSSLMRFATSKKALALVVVVAAVYFWLRSRRCTSPPPSPPLRGSSGANVLRAGGQTRESKCQAYCAKPGSVPAGTCSIPKCVQLCTTRTKSGACGDPGAKVAGDDDPPAPKPHPKPAPKPSPAPTPTPDVDPDDIDEPDIDEPETPDPDESDDEGETPAEREARERRERQEKADIERERRERAEEDARREAKAAQDREIREREVREANDKRLRLGVMIKGDSIVSRADIEREEVPAVVLTSPAGTYRIWPRHGGQGLAVQMLSRREDGDVYVDMSSSSLPNALGGGGGGEARKSSTGRATLVFDAQGCLRLVDTKGAVLFELENAVDVDPSSALRLYLTEAGRLEMRLVEAGNERVVAFWQLRENAQPASLVVGTLYQYAGRIWRIDRDGDARIQRRHVENPTALNQWTSGSNPPIKEAPRDFAAKDFLNLTIGKPIRQLPDGISNGNFIICETSWANKTEGGVWLVQKGQRRRFASKAQYDAEFRKTRGAELKSIRCPILASIDVGPPL